MKSTKKVMALLLVAVMVVGMLAGCSGKKKDAKELFVNAFDTYHNAVAESSVVKLVNDAMAGGSVAVKYEADDEHKTMMHYTAYLNKAGNAASLTFNAKVEGKDIDAQMLVDQNKVVLGSSILKSQYGLDFSKSVENFPTSLFGTKGENLFGMTEEDEKELTEQLQELADSLKQEFKTVDMYKLLMDTITDNGTFTAETKASTSVGGKDVKCTTVTATFTKNNVKSMANKLVAELGAQEYIDQVIANMNETTEWEAEWEGTEAKTYENMNDLIDEMFEDKGDEDVVFTIKMYLDSKHDAMMKLELTAKKTTTIEFGADPQNITQIGITYPTEEMPVDSTEPITKMEKMTIDIKKSATSVEYQLINEEQEGLVLVINKAHKEVTFTEIVDGKLNADDSYSFKYDLTKEHLTVIFTEEGDEYTDAATITITLTANAESPVKFDNYIDLLKMDKTQLEKLGQDIYDFMGMEEEFNLDELLGNTKPDVETDDGDFEFGGDITEDTTDNTDA